MQAKVTKQEECSNRIICIQTNNLRFGNSCKTNKARGMFESINEKTRSQINRKKKQYSKMMTGVIEVAYDKSETSNQHVIISTFQLAEDFGTPTSFLASKASLNCLKSSGGEVWSISAPSIEIGTLTPEIQAKYNKEWKKGKKKGERVAINKTHLKIPAEILYLTKLRQKQFGSGKA